MSRRRALDGFRGLVGPRHERLEVTALGDDPVRRPFLIRPAARIDPDARDPIWDYLVSPGMRIIEALLGVAIVALVIVALVHYFSH